MDKHVNVTVSANPIKVSERFDASGNKIDPVTGRIIETVQE